MANFFNAGGGRPTGAGYVVQFNMRGAKARLYDHGLSSASWATGLSDLAALDLQARLPRWPARHNAIAPPAPPLTSPPALCLQDGGEEAPDRPIAPPTSTIAFERDLGRGELALAYWNVTGATWDGRFSLSMPVGESAKVWGCAFAPRAVPRPPRAATGVGGAHAQRAVGAGGRRPPPRAHAPRDAPCALAARRFLLSVGPQQTARWSHKFEFKAVRAKPSERLARARRPASGRRSSLRARPAPARAAAARAAAQAPDAVQAHSAACEVLLLPV